MPFLGSGGVSDWIPLQPDMGQERVPSGGYPRKPLRDKRVGVGWWMGGVGRLDLSLLLRRLSRVPCRGD